MENALTKIASVSLALLASLIETGCVATRASFHLGEWSEHVEKYDRAYVCDRQFYVTYLATGAPYVGDEQLLLAEHLGASTKFHDSRFIEISLDAMEWANCPPGAGCFPLISPPPRKPMPTFGRGRVPIDVANCEKAFPIDNLGQLRIDAHRTDLFGNLLVEPLAREEFSVVGSDNGIAVSRKAAAGIEWALLGSPNRLYRSCWSYPAFALALGPAVIVDVVTFPFVLLATGMH